jgi:hypothetical protein
MSKRLQGLIVGIIIGGMIYATLPVAALSAQKMIGVFTGVSIYTCERLKIPTAFACFTRLQPQCKTGQRSERSERRSPNGALRSDSGNKYHRLAFMEISNARRYISTM